MGNLDLYVHDQETGALLGSSTSSDATESVSGQTAAPGILILVRNVSGTVVPYSLGGNANATTRAVNDACRNAAPLPDAITPLNDDQHTTLNGAANDHEFSEPTCLGSRMPGSDTFFSLALEPQQTLTVTLDSTDNLALYLLSSCTDNCCWAGADETTSGVETLTYTNATGVRQDLILVVDSAEPPDVTYPYPVFSLSSTIE
ncbi:MAG: hypothetical protein AB2A00_15545 [Myxococcota bacterium]